MEPQGQFGSQDLLMILLWAVVVIIPFWKISVKAGYSGWLSLLMVIPIANLVYLYFLAFSNWPARRDDHI